MSNQNKVSLAKLRTFTKDNLFLNVNSPKLKKFNSTFKIISCSSKMIKKNYSPLPTISDYKPFIKIDKRILKRKITNILNEKNETKIQKEEINIEKENNRLFISKSNLKCLSKENTSEILGKKIRKKSHKINFENFKKILPITKRFRSKRHIITKKKFKKDLDNFFLNEIKFNVKKERIAFVLINNNKLNILKYGIFCAKYDSLKNNIKEGIKEIIKNKKNFKKDKNLYIYNIYGKLIYDENLRLFNNLKEKKKDCNLFQRNNLNFDKFSRNIFFLTNHKNEYELLKFLKNHSNYKKYNDFLIIFLKTFKKYCFVKNKIKFNNKLINTAKKVLKKNFKTPNFSSQKLKKLYTSLKLTTFFQPSLKTFKSKLQKEEKFVKSMNLKKIQKNYLKSEETLFFNPKKKKIKQINEYYENLIKFLPNNNNLQQIENYKSKIKRKSRDKKRYKSLFN